MSTTIKTYIRPLAGLALATAFAACSDARATESAQDDLRRDLELASATTMNLAGPRIDPALLNSMETAPLAAPEPATTVRKGVGTRALRSRTLTVKAAPESEAADEEVGELESLAEAPVPDISEPVAVAPQPPVPVVVSAPAGDYGTGSGGGTGGIFVGNGGIFGGGGGGRGTVLRGGGVHGDNCELHRSPRVGRGPIFRPSVPSTAQPSSRPPRSTPVSVAARDRGADRRAATTASAPAESPRSRPSGSRRGL